MKSSRKQAGLICAITIIMAFSLTLAPTSFAQARVRTHPNVSANRTYEENATYEPGKANGPEINLTVTDESTGIAALIPLDKLTPEFESCFSVEVLSDDGETQVIKPCVSTMEESEEVSLAIPIDPNHVGYTPKVYICGDDEQEVEATTTSDTIRATVPNQASVKIIYVAPTDIAQTDDESTGESSSTKINTVIPDDDDEPESTDDEDEDHTFFEVVAAFITALIIIGIFLLIGLFVTFGSKEALQILSRLPKALIRLIKKLVKVALEPKN